LIENKEDRWYKGTEHTIFPGCRCNRCSPKASPKLNANIYTIRRKSISPKNFQVPKKKKSKKRKERSKEITEAIGLMLPVIDEPKRKRYLSKMPTVAPEVSD
jgi:hypothetical protein